MFARDVSTQISSPAPRFLAGISVQAATEVASSGLVRPIESCSCPWLCQAAKGDIKMSHWELHSRGLKGLLQVTPRERRSSTEMPWSAGTGDVTSCQIAPTHSSPPGAPLESLGVYGSTLQPTVLPHTRPGRGPQPSLIGDL